MGGYTQNQTWWDMGNDWQTDLRTLSILLFRSFAKLCRTTVHGCPLGVWARAQRSIETIDLQE